MKRKLSIVLLGVFVCNINTFAHEVITFTWQVVTSKSFYIRATPNKTFTIDWGDGSDIEIYTGQYYWDHITHTYNTAGNYLVTLTKNTEEGHFLSFESTYNQLNTLNISGCTYLSSLLCQNNQLTSLDISGCTGLQSLYCYNNQLTNIDVSSNKALIKLWCSSNLLNSLYLSNLTELTLLYIYDNQITSIDISNCEKLEYLYCNNSQLTSLDVSNNKALKYLHCFHNQLVSLDISNNTELLEVFCYDNQLSRLDVSNCKKLEYLYCHNNQLINLDISNSIALKELYCGSNQLTSLNASGCTKLVYLSCANNLLSILDVGDCRSLEYLYGYNNQLTNLDIGSCTAIKNLWIYNNRLPLSDLYAASERINAVDSKLLGFQTMLPQRVALGNLLFSTQSVFNGRFTSYTVTKNGSPAPENDYTITDGTITFNTLGIYTVTMRNDAIVSNTFYPAQVTIDIMVVDNTGIEENELSDIRVFPNPTTGELRIENGELRINSVEIFDVFGRKLNNSPFSILHSQLKMDISHLPAGIYMVKIIVDGDIYVRKIIKTN